MISGVIAEFNPFHKGHAYLLDQAEGLKIVAMSGNFVQRGEPAIIDKWTRTQMALDNGADLVVELPFSVSVQAADFFAQGAVDILARLGMDQLVFGTEQLLDYNALKNSYQDKKKQIEAYLASLPDSLSYPQKTQQAWQELLGLDFSGDTPNHILGLAYTKAAIGHAFDLRPVQRQGAGFHSLALDTDFASATALRQGIDQPDFLEKFSPAAQLITAAAKVTWQDYFPLLRYQIMVQSDLTKIYQVNQEMAVRLKEAIKTSLSFEELVAKLATKRYTKARVRRLLTYILVQAQEAPLPQSIRILGFSPQGQEHLSKIKSQVDLVSRIGKAAWDQMTQQADRIYQLGNPDLPEQNYGRVPLRSK
ncbi:nucleotidyltransferase [Streptococcus oricebi]|uniref:tRNA(Met) cytidine acetate ligase n=1 Tax=Streptococcus oricebi TaxID=1547447 RepID=A0ABS5B1W0_9STRE|nr:nucleotidyltransferase [Streptococcus oricebi]MBP2622792.1 nucleotidyltransferase [Streptococcus oricebi]